MSGAIWFMSSEYDFWEVLSAMQKSIRRGLEDEALFWGTELYLNGAPGHAWNRLLIIASEDIGLASSTVGLLVKSLHDTWKQLPKESKDDGGRLFFIHALLLLVRAPKSRIVDHALITDRGAEHFFDEGAVLNGESLGDTYRDRARQIRKDCGDAVVECT
jgi:replication-associated recombination protein RarA